MTLEDLKSDENELREVTPAEMGYKPAEPEKQDNRDDVDRALDVYEKEVLPRKREEIDKLNDILEATGGQISKQELNEAMGMGFANELYGSNPIPLNTKPMEKVMAARKQKEDAENTEKMEDEEDENELLMNSIKTGFEEEDIDEDDMPTERPVYNNKIRQMDTKEDTVYNMSENTKLDIKDEINMNDNVEVNETEDDFMDMMNDNTEPEVNNSFNMVPEIANDINEVIKDRTNIDTKKILTLENKPEEDEYVIPRNLSELEFPDDEDEDEDGTAARSTTDRDSEIINSKLKEAVKSKIHPVAKGYDLSAFTISKKPVALNAVLNNVESPNLKYADWVAYSTGHKFRMLGFTGAEIDKLNNPNGNRLQSETVRYKMLFDHIIDKDKPDTMEQWVKRTSFFDIEHYWFGAFRGTFEGAAYMPITNCPNDQTHVFLTDNLDIMEFIKFENDEAKDRFYKIYDGQIAESKELYKSDIVPVSDNFAVAFREPSIYNMVFEVAMLDQEFVDKYRDIIALITYIDDIYYVNRQTMQLEPINYKYWPNNVAKTAKSKIIQFAKALRKLSSDQYHTLLTYIQEITERGDHITYQIPEVTCPECQATIEAMPISGKDLVFTRHQLAALAAL